MGNLFAELKRRHIYRVAAAYAVVAWVLLQLVNNIAPVLDLPPWIARAMILLLAIGFPVALVLAWVLELKAADATARAATGRLDWVLIGALVVVIGLVSYEQLSRAPGAATAQQPSVAAARLASAAVGNAISIAVLPFANVSADASQDFFSDGMTDEIAGALAKVPDLRVVARSSAFEFKGQNKEARAIGQALGATHLIEGSVRQAGNRVRITAQLIQAENGLQIWSENYDREVTDVFAIQEDIARAITTSLRMPLGLKPGENLVNNRTGDLDSYQQYLRARALYRARALDQVTAVLEAVVASDPKYAPAWALLARSYTLALGYNAALRESGSLEEQRRVLQSIYEKAEMAAREAIRLDPKHPLGYAALGAVEIYHGRRTAGYDLYQQALALDPNDPEILDLYSQALATVGHLRESLRLREQLRTLEPFVPIYNITTVDIMRLNGQSKATIPMLEAISPGGAEVTYVRNLELATTYAAAKRYSEAADTLLAIPANQNRVSRRSVEDAARLRRSAPTNVKAPETLPVFNDEMNFAYAYVGAMSRVLEFPERSQQLRGSGAVGVTQLWSPLYVPLRKTERFKALVRNAGLVDYWRARGWPDLCRPMGADFVCD